MNNSQQPIKQINTIPLLATVLGCGLMIFIGCEQKEIHAYRVAREFGGSTTVHEHQPNNDKNQTESNEVVWTVPDSWELLDKKVSMRFATFMTPPKIEVTLAVFPGDVGGLLANVNRWRGQVGLVPIQESELNEVAKQIEGTNSFVVDAVGPSVRLVGTVINVGDGKTWFVKVIGESEAVDQVKEDIVTFSASFHTKAPTPEVNESQNNNPNFKWNAPTSWSIDTNASPILMSAYYTDGGARVTLTALGGGGGGTLDNINRWRDQLGLDAVNTTDGLAITDLGKGALLVDLISADRTKRIVAGIVPLDSKTLFFKLTGTESETESELDRFNEFVIGVGLQERGEN